MREPESFFIGYHRLGFRAYVAKFFRQPKIKGQFRLLNCNPMIFGFGFNLCASARHQLRGSALKLIPEGAYRRAQHGVEGGWGTFAQGHVLMATWPNKR